MRNNRKPLCLVTLLVILLTAASCGPWVMEPEATAENSMLPHNLRDQFLPDLENLTGASQYTLTADISLEDGVMYVRGEEQIAYTNQEQQPLDVIYLRLFPNVSGDYLSISGLTINDEKVEPVLMHEKTTARLDLSEPLDPDESLLIALDYEAAVPGEMAGNYGLYTYTDDILALDAFFPIIPVFEDGEWQVEAPPINADMFYTDPAFFTVTVTAPEDYVIAAGGREISKKWDKMSQIVTFSGGPMRDFYLAASPRFVSEARDHNGVMVTSFFVEEFRSAGERVLKIAIDALDAFENRFGLYPYDELDLVSTPMQAGGMEYSGITALGIQFYDPASSIQGGGMPGSVFLEAATAHEIAHMWFYGQVMTDQIDEPWMDESLVQYVTSLYYLDAYGPAGQNGFMDSLEARWDRVEREPVPIGMAAAGYSPLEYGAIVYGRGALFFADLADLMGTEKFEKFLSQYIAAYRWSTARPDDFLSLASDVCGCDLTALIEEYGVDS